MPSPDGSGNPLLPEIYRLFRNGIGNKDCSGQQENAPKNYRIKIVKYLENTLINYGADHIDGDGVVFVVRDNDVGECFCRFDKLLVHWF